MLAGEIGFIDTPNQRNARPDGVAWCADNGAYSDRFDAAYWWAFLTKHAQAAASCLFAVAPDVVGDAVAVEDAGFEVRDSIAWLYGSGFPKSLDVSKAIDKTRTEDLQPAADVAKWLVDQLTARGLGRRDVTDHFDAANIAQQWTTCRTDGAVKPRVPRWEQWQELRRWLDLPGDMDAEVWRLNGRKGKPGDNFDAREVLSERITEVKGGSWAAEVGHGRFRLGEKVIQETAPATDAARTWQGWGTALKPAFEPIVVARKPLAGTVAANVLAHGTGALNVDGCRIEGEPWKAHDATGLGSVKFFSEGDTPVVHKEPHDAGRWPANVILDEDQAAALDAQSGTLKSGANPTRRGSDKFRDAYGDFKGQEECTPARGVDVGGASRFFYVARWDTNEGRWHLPIEALEQRFLYVAKAPAKERPKVVTEDGTTVAHPTVKPLTLMRWLVRLVTPPGGLVLDTFAGSGTTGEAALLEGFRFLGAEREADYLPLIEARLTKELPDREPAA
jgi:hypothetical protein